MESACETSMKTRSDQEEPSFVNMKTGEEDFPAKYKNCVYSLFLLCVCVCAEGGGGIV